MALDEADKKALQELIAAAVKPVADGVAEAAKNQKILADTFAADQLKAKEAADAAAKAAAAAGAGGGDPARKKDEPAGAAAKPLTADEVASAIEARLKARDEAAASTAARDKFLAETLKDVPAAYHGQISNDPAKWKDEAQAIRGRLKADLEGLGFKPKDVAGGDAGGTTPSGATTATPAQLAAQFKTMGLSDGEADFASKIKVPALA